MYDDLSPSLAASLAGPTTLPIFLVRVVFSGEMRLATTRANVDALGFAWIGGRLDVTTADGWETCTLRIENADGALTGVALDASWVGGAIEVWYAALLTDGYIDPDYVEDQDNFIDPTGIETVKRFKGWLDAAQAVHPWVELSCSRGGVGDGMTPGIRLDAPLTNHAIPAGTIIAFDGETYVVQAETRVG